MCCNPPGLLQESLGPFGPEVSRECAWSVPRGVSGALRAPGSGVSKKCPRSVRDTFLTLGGHSRDTFLDTLEFGARRAPETPRGTLPGHCRDTSGPKGPRDSCSRPGGLQHVCGDPLSRYTCRRRFPKNPGVFQFFVAAVSRYIPPKLEVSEMASTKIWDRKTNINFFSINFLKTHSGCSQKFMLGKVYARNSLCFIVEKGLA